MKKIVSVFLSCLILVGAIIVLPLQVAAATPGAAEMKSIINGLRNEFPEGRYMDDNWLYQNYYGTGCWAFGTLVFERIFGIRPKGNIGENRNQNAELYVGDWLRVDNDNHTVVITDLNIAANQVSYVDCNHGNTNQVHWHDNQSLSALRSRITYIYHMPGNTVQSLSTAAPAQNPWIEVDAPSVLNETNIQLEARVRNPGGVYIPTIGCTIWDYSGKVIKEHTESMNAGYVRRDNVHIWFNANSELGITLQKGTVYQYEIYIWAGSDRFSSGKKEFVTSGNYQVSLQPNGGNCSTGSINTLRGRKYGTLPTPTRNGYEFEGWYTEPNGGEKITESTIFTDTKNQTLYAHYRATRLFDYSVNLDNTATITKYLGSGGAVTIPGTLDGHIVTKIGQDAFLNRIDLTSVIIPDSVVEIGRYAFSATGLTSVTILGNVSKIDLAAFFGCTELVSLTVSGSITEIGEWAFAGCTALTSVTIPKSVISIDEYAFSVCIGLTSVTIPKSTTWIGQKAFDNCNQLTIYGYKGSCAEAYAKANRITFVTLSEPSQPPKNIPGDIDGDGKVSVTDALAILRMAVGLSTPVDNADIDGMNGVTVTDALAVLRMAVGL